MYVESAMGSGGDLVNANPNPTAQGNSSELSKILVNIQQREVKISQFLEEKSSVRPPPPSPAIVSATDLLFLHACMHTYIHTYIHTYKNLFICTTYMNMYIYS